MAFCTNCGADITGAICVQCGRPAAQSAAAGAPTPAPAAAPASAAVPAVAPRRTSPIVWVLVILLVLFGIGILAVVGTAGFVLHRARRAGIDADLFRSNPGLAIGKMIAATHPGLDVIDTDERTGTVTLRDRRNGKRFTMSFDSARNGSFKLKADDGEGGAGSVEFGAGAKLPSWIPQYPGSNPETVFSATGDSGHDAGEAGNFNFQTDDDASKVLSFYEDKAKELGMTLHTVGAGQTGTVAASDDNDRFLKVIAIGHSGRTTVNVTYGRKR
jgi:hypothetical protein